MARITIALLGNIHFDTRTTNLMRSLNQRGHGSVFIGFDWLSDDFIPARDQSIRLHRLKKHRISPLFYLCFAVILIRELCKRRSDIYLASDFFTYPFLFAAAKLTGAKIYYDSREIYTEINGLTGRRLVRKCVGFLERIMITRTDAVFVTGPADAVHLFEKYRIMQPLLLRNLPVFHSDNQAINFRTRFALPRLSKILLYQGILVRGRGIELCIRLVARLQEYGLVLLGGGEHESDFRELVQTLKIEDRVIFAGKIPQHELFRYTVGCDIGLALIDNISKNNELALPNKLFEYIMAGLPVIVSDLPQMRHIVETYGIGGIISENSITEAAELLAEWDRHPEKFQHLKSNCQKAAADLNWDREFGQYSPLFDMVRTQKKIRGAVDGPY
ncbi:glycosyltransferase [bacterium]|nr:glycosyltransferase [bacterium]